MIEQRNEETLEELVKEARRRYDREWRQKNKDKVKESNHRYWVKRALKEREERENAENEDN